MPFRLIEIKQNRVIFIVDVRVCRLSGIIAENVYDELLLFDEESMCIKIRPYYSAVEYYCRFSKTYRHRNGVIKWKPMAKNSIGQQT